MRQHKAWNALVLVIGAGLLLVGAALAQPSGFGKSGQPAAVQQKDGKAGIIIDDGSVTTVRPEAIEPGDIFQPGQKGSAVGKPSPGAAQGSGGKAGIIILDGTLTRERPDAIEPGEIFQPGQRGSAVGRSSPKAPQASGAAGTPMIEPGEIFRPGQ
jgi:hypothetical protein